MLFEGERIVHESSMTICSRSSRFLAQHEGAHAGLQFLSTLVSVGALQIKIAYRPGSPGIFHDKVGVFTSTDAAAVAFMGSSNESQSAILSEWNHESFAAFTSWQGSVDAERVLEMSKYFVDLWTKGEPGLVVAPLGQVPQGELDKHRHPQGLQAAAQALRSHLSQLTSPSSRPTREPRPLLAHQSAVVHDWIDKGFRGIVKHATGAGKTLTAIEGIRRWISDGRPALVLVPSDLLMNQWIEELQDELATLNPTYLYAGGSKSSHNWSQDLPDFTRSASYLGPRVVVATMQTASTERFMAKTAPGEHLLVVADEVHRIGSSKHRNILEIASGGRLALSATPERFGDPEGTEAIQGYFGQALFPEFGIGDAIRCGRLVPYDYHIHVVALNENEQRRWDELTERIKMAYVRLPQDKSGGKLQTDQYRSLLIRRASILKRAEGKLALATNTIKDNFSPSDRWLVYCDNSIQLRLVLDSLRSMGLDAHEYHSGMTGARRETFGYFQESGGILVAIKCLDEGIDIPSVNRALILASSSNPREFIQRRGRVLRRSTGKYSAAIHDALVVPNGGNENQETAPILHVELARAIEFAKHAQNRAVHHHLHDLARQFNVTSSVDRSTDHEEER